VKELALAPSELEACRLALPVPASYTLPFTLFTLTQARYVEGPGTLCRLPFRQLSRKTVP
jgi:hypothetical protein